VGRGAAEHGGLVVNLNYLIYSVSFLLGLALPWSMYRMEKIGVPFLDDRHLDELIVVQRLLFFSSSFFGETRYCCLCAIKIAHRDFFFNTRQIKRLLLQQKQRFPYNRNL
jgi:hypothetical protein